MVMEEEYPRVRLTKSLTMTQYDNDAVKDSIGAFICVSGEFLGSIFRIRSGNRFYFGRDYKTVDFYFRNETISGRHCWIEYQAGQRRYAVYDESLNGTYLNGEKRLPKNTLVYLNRGDEIRLGNTDNIIKLG